MKKYTKRLFDFLHGAFLTLIFLKIPLSFIIALFIPFDSCHRPAGAGDFYPSPPNCSRGNLIQHLQESVTGGGGFSALLAYLKILILVYLIFSLLVYMIQEARSRKDGFKIVILKNFLFKRFITKLLLAILSLTFIYFPFSIFPSRVRIDEFYARLSLHCIAIILLEYLIFSLLFWIIDRLIIKAELIKKVLIILITVLFIAYPFKDSIYLGILGIVYNSDSYAGKSNSQQYSKYWHRYCHNMEKAECSASTICHDEPMDCMAGCIYNCTLNTRGARILPRKTLMHQALVAYDQLDRSSLDPECKKSESWDRHGSFYIKDNKVCLRRQRYYPEIDGETFELINRTYVKDKNHIYVFDDFNDEYGIMAQILDADVETFEPIGSYDSVYAKDKNNVYGCGRIIKNADMDTFEFVEEGNGYAKDKNYIYKKSRYYSELRVPNCAVGIIKNADPKNFDYDQYIKDNRNNYDENDLILIK